MSYLARLLRSDRTLEHFQERVALPPRLWERAVLFLGFVVLIGSRMPHVLRGRFWAEDGLFFLDALSLLLPDALSTPRSGYLNIVASLAGQAARLLPLEFAPVASCAVALLVQSLPGFLIVTSRIPWLQDRGRMALALLLVATPPLTEEVWINPITSQYHLMLCAGLILAEGTRAGAVGAVHLAILALAPLAGPGNAFLIPLYGWRAWRARSWPRALQLLALLPGTLVQLAMLAMHPEPHRNLGIAPHLLFAVIYVKHLLVPFLGRHQVQDAAGHLPALFAADSLPLQPVLLVLLAAAAFAIGLWRSGNRQSAWLAAAGLLILGLSYLAAWGGQADLLVPQHGMRYAFAPQALLSLAVLGIAATSPGRVRRAARLVVLWLAFVGLHEFWWTSPEMARGPSWRAQIRERMPGSEAPIKLWPEGWSVRLPPGL